ncbi:hypothetical protein WA026_006373 [Henosepilachna vigintioctopunctata]|uniref:Uncharacterized protein n=1 Tax=Henosepilachna vigintioctopunctata TaxID=420089 RepID=A0AAW1TR91_9CUCU
MLKIRRKRDVDVSENDIYNDNEIIDRTKVSSSSTTSETPTTILFDSTITTETLDTTSPNNTTESLEIKMQNIINLIKDIFHLKLNLGLDLVKNTTRSISTYVEKVQQKFNRHYRNS